MASWVWWLAGPALATLAACALAWVAGRPRRLPGTRRAVSEHRDFLAGLAAVTGPESAVGRTGASDTGG